MEERRDGSRPGILWIVVVLLLAGGLLAGAGDFHPTKLWTMAGQDLQNTRFQKSDSQLKRQHLDALEVKWVFETNERISATATVDKDYVYVPDWDQSVFKLRRDDGSVVWAASIGDFTGLPGDFTRDSPTLYENLVLVGDMGGLAGLGAKMMALDRETGELVWIRQVDTHPTSFVTQSPVVHNGVLYVGISSFETIFASLPNYPCCTFRGSLLAMNVYTGDILWRTYFTPEPPPGWTLAEDGPWFSGTAIWGSTVAIDEERGKLYVTTGQNYTVPQSVLDCVEAANESGGDASVCNHPDNHFDAIAAVDLATGAIDWGTPRLPFDAWTLACILGPAANCPSPQGPDFDFAQGPSLFTTPSGRQLVGAGQKSGAYHALDPDSGELVWSTQVGPGGTAGGLQWGSAVDGERIYVAVANSNRQTWNLVNPATDSPATTDGGGWSALDAETGAILWQTAAPGGAVAWSPVAVNKRGLVFACAMDPVGHMYILDHETGERLWSFASGGSCVAGATLVDKEIYWGSGYRGPGPLGVPNNEFYAFHYVGDDEE